MRLQRSWSVALFLAAFVPLACHGGKNEDDKLTPKGVAEERKPHADFLRNEIPPDQLDAVMAAHFAGVGHMERYEYDEAATAFRSVHECAPGWIPGSINLAIALLNQTGNQAEAVKNADGKAPRTHFEEALDLLGDVLKREPENLHARFCRGTILEYLGEFTQAHPDFVFVTEHDPQDGHAWLKFGSTLSDPSDATRPAGPAQAKELIALYSKALECNPYLVPALYKLQTAYAWAGERDKQKELLQLWSRLNPKKSAVGPGDTAENFYGEMGRHATIIDSFRAPKPPTEVPAPPRFGPAAPLSVTLPEGQRWVKQTDFIGPLAVIGRARARFGAGVATFDADGDGRLDLFLTAAVHGPKGVRDALLLNRGEGKYEDVSLAWGLPEDRASIGVAAGDFDADRKLDLFLTSVGGNRLLRNLGKKFEDVTQAAGIGGAGGVSVTARWLDLDQDGDLDLYVVNHAGPNDLATAFTDKTPPGLANAAYRNDGKPAPISGRPEDNWAPLAVAPADLPAKTGLSLAFTSWPDAPDLLGGSAPHTAVAALDVDGDRDIDLVLSADGAPLTVVLNDRLGRFHSIALQEPKLPESLGGLLVIDLDKDGRADLVGVGPPGRVLAWRNATQRGAPAWENWPTNAEDWRCAVAADADLDTWPDLIGLRASAGLVWDRNEGARLSAAPLAVAGAGEQPVGFAYANLTGDALPDLLIVGDGTPPRLARNLGNGEHWLALDLSGRWKTSFDHMRTNPHGLGAQIALEGEGLVVSYPHTTPEAGTAQSVGPIFLGLGKSPSAQLLRVRWPDGTMQSELNVARDQTLALTEHNRKTGSCPVLFTWNGARFECLGDFLGGGGIGYLVAPGVYGQPDRDEALAISPDQLRPVRGVYRLAVVEPMDEVAYLDRLVLDVVDRPPGVSATPDERFAPEGPRPTGALIAWRQVVEPRRATDLEGQDVTDRLRAWDRKTVDGFRTLDGWIGYAEEHGIILDFGDRLSKYGPRDPLVLCLAGWVEYPYSQTNYAAATAGVVLQPPSVERRRADGTWEVIEPHAGYPAGLPRLTTLDLTGKLSGAHCVLRLRTNMECYWDQAFVAVPDPNAGPRVTPLPVARAALGYRGYLREVTPDGRAPLLYDYDHVDPAPLARLQGRLTRYGEVAGLLRNDDDRLCLVGPGDEVRLEFDTGPTPALPEGWTRSFVLRAVGYCKDADPCTATGDTIAPLPWRAMPDGFPLGTAVERPSDEPYRAYLREYQTRPASAR